MKLKHVLIMSAAVTAALATTACSRQAPYADGYSGGYAENARVCRDKRGVRVDDRRCQRSSSGGGASNAFLWYYLGRSSAIPAVGQSTNGYAGTYRPTPGVNYSAAPRSYTSASTRSSLMSSTSSYKGSGATSSYSSSSVSRGGFGSIGGGFSAGS